MCVCVCVYIYKLKFDRWKFLCWNSQQMGKIRIYVGQLVSFPFKMCLRLCRNIYNHWILKTNSKQISFFEKYQLLSPQIDISTKIQNIVYNHCKYIRTSNNMYITILFMFELLTTSIEPCFFMFEHITTFTLLYLTITFKCRISII